MSPVSVKSFNNETARSPKNNQDLGSQNDTLNFSSMISPTTKNKTFKPEVSLYDRFQ
jgi:hypothetical protein